jgi:hypothetical protein
MLQLIYLVLCIVGTILPYSQFVPFLLENGFDLSLFFDQLMANSISRFAWIDVVISSLALWFFIYHESSRLGMKNFWIYVLSNLLFGVSLALPLFLLMRERRLQVDNTLASSKSFPSP